MRARRGNDKTWAQGKNRWHEMAQEGTGMHIVGKKKAEKTEEATGTMWIYTEFINLLIIITI